MSSPPVEHLEESTTLLNLLPAGKFDSNDFKIEFNLKFDSDQHPVWNETFVNPTASLEDPPQLEYDENDMDLIADQGNFEKRFLQ